MTRFTFSVGMTLALLTLSTACGGTSGDKVTFISGTASTPVSGIVGRTEIALGNASIVFDDFTPLPPATSRTNPLLGTTDANGAFAVSIEDTKLVVLSVDRVINNVFRRSQAVVVTDGTIIQKNLNAVSTLAAFALARGVEEELLSLSDITQLLILRAEQLAQVVASEQVVDLNNEESIEAAAIAILTRLLALPPSAFEEMPPSDPTDAELTEEDTVTDEESLETLEPLDPLDEANQNDQSNNSNDLSFME